MNTELNVKKGHDGQREWMILLFTNYFYSVCSIMKSMKNMNRNGCLSGVKKNALLILFRKLWECIPVWYYRKYLIE